ncbi:MAG: molecular chaperone TorD family protein [Desulfobacterales bacterium]|nr:molecular chaperone TorD family protein [Desulfobacterales bacterium]
MRAAELNEQAITTEVPDIFFSQQLSTPEQMALSSRIDMYAIMADIFRYPDALSRVYVRNGEFKNNFLRIAENLPYPFAMNDNEIRDLTYPETLKEEDVEIEFIRLFEAGPGNPACPLVEGVLMNKEEGRKSIFKDLILFYNHFGLSYAEGSSEDRPDHLIYELEFLHYLTFLELTALQKDRDASPFRRAQRDFLQRHPLKWTGVIVERMMEIEAGLKENVNKDVIAFYRNVIVLMDRLLNCDFNYINN